MSNRGARVLQGQKENNNIYLKDPSAVGGGANDILQKENPKVSGGANDIYLQENTPTASSGIYLQDNKPV